jgi:ArsR family transcriptional regulator, lead/cadmium/zinc/bismuth-responsive transcriptional repressor
MLRENELCSDCSSHKVVETERLRESLIEVSGLSELFRVLSDETRTKILYLLSQEELCVYDIAQVMEMTLPAVSHHLRLLKAMRLVRSRREGKNVFYMLDDDHVVSLIKVAQEHYIDEAVR